MQWAKPNCSPTLLGTMLGFKLHGLVCEEVALLVSPDPFSVLSARIKSYSLPMEARAHKFRVFESLKFLFFRESSSLK